MRAKIILLSLLSSMCLSGCAQSSAESKTITLENIPEIQDTSAIQSGSQDSSTIQSDKQDITTMQPETEEAEEIEEARETKFLLSQDCAVAYLGIINELSEIYGEGTVEAMIYGDSIMQGLGMVRLIDFDGDGTLELYCAYNTKPDIWVNQQVIYGYSPEQGLIEIMEPSGVSNPGTDVSPVTTFMYKDDKVYLIYGYELRYFDYLTVENNELVSAFSYEHYWYEEGGGQIDGESVTEEELERRVEEMESGGVKKTIGYYSPEEEDLLETISTIEDIEILSKK